MRTAKRVNGQTIPGPMPELDQKVNMDQIPNYSFFLKEIFILNYSFLKNEWKSNGIIQSKLLNTKY